MTTSVSQFLFSDVLLDWYTQHGRVNLPWQQDRSLYRVWVSEIMLQQTQVATVIPYFERFMCAFADITALANASQDQVLHLWTGLGYYARARNLHKAAITIRDDYAAVFPQNYQQILALAGIGRSTASAILAQACDQPYAILDGNVKRVLSRFHAIAGWPGKRDVENQLWAFAEQHSPQTRCADYTQAIMDLGATVCTRSQPDCAHCPLRNHCEAFIQGDPRAYPGKKPKKPYPCKTTRMLIIQHANTILLQQRPPSGIWGSLWSFPECHSQLDGSQWCKNKLGLDVHFIRDLPLINHKFSHFQLDIRPQLLTLNNQQTAAVVMENQHYVWYNTCQPDARGLPAPIKQLIDGLFKSASS